MVSAGDVLLGPLVELFYPMPNSALIPVTVLWLGFGNGSKILLIFLGCMLPVTIGAFNGARSSEQVLVWSARSMGASRLRMLWDVVVPSALPELLNGFRTALALSFILLVSSELIVAQQGLGYLIGFLGENGTYDAMFAVVLTLAFLGFAADRLYLAPHATVAAMAGVADRTPGRRCRRCADAAGTDRVLRALGWGFARIFSILRAGAGVGMVRALGRGDPVHAAEAHRGSGAYLERSRFRRPPPQYRRHRLPCHGRVL